MFADAYKSLLHMPGMSNDLPPCDLTHKSENLLWMILELRFILGSM